MSTSVSLHDHLSDTLRLPWTDDDVAASIATRFRRVVARFGAREAVRSGEQSLSYEQLDRAANRLGRAIQAQIGANGEPVAIMLQHGIPAIVAIMAVIKSGNIYVPLDPGQPVVRAAAIVADAGARLLLAGGAALERPGRSQAASGRDRCRRTGSDTFDRRDLATRSGRSVAQHYVYLRLNWSSKGCAANARQLAARDARNAPVPARTIEWPYCLRSALARRRRIFIGAIERRTLLLFDLKGEGRTALAGWLRRER